MTIDNDNREGGGLHHKQTSVAGRGSTIGKGEVDSTAAKAVDRVAETANRSPITFYEGELDNR